MPKILLVEDDINLREIYAARLAAESYQVVSASDGEEALAIAVREKPHLILLDVMMPKISGFDVLDILRSTPETKNTRVIMLTALSQKSDRARGEQLGVNKYLVKSQITLEDVVQTIRDTLSDVDDGQADDDSDPDQPNDSDQIEAAVKTLSKKPRKIKVNKRAAVKDKPAAEIKEETAAQKFKQSSHPTPGSSNPNHPGAD